MAEVTEKASARECSGDSYTLRLRRGRGISSFVGTRFVQRAATHHTHTQFGVERNRPVDEK